MLAERVQEWKKEWKQEALKEGRQEGHREGHREGIHEGKSKMLRQLLEYKFGSLEERVIEQLRTAEDQQLQEWGKRILTAASLNDIFDN